MPTDAMSDSRSASAQSAISMPCIRCGQCIDVCPVLVSPMQLLRDIEAERFSQARTHGLLDCTECGRCDPVCPSRIPLLELFRVGKQALQAEECATAAADAARERYLARKRRLVDEQGERSERDASRTATAVSADAVAAAIERANARRRARLGDPS